MFGYVGDEEIFGKHVQEFVSPLLLEKPLYRWRSLFSYLISSTVGQGTWSASSAVSEHTTGKERI